MEFGKKNLWALVRFGRFVWLVEIKCRWFVDWNTRTICNICLLQAEARAEFAEKTVKKLQKEVDRLEGTCFAVFVANTLLNPEVHLVY